MSNDSSSSTCSGVGESSSAAGVCLPSPPSAPVENVACYEECTTTTVPLEAFAASNTGTITPPPPGFSAEREARPSQGDMEEEEEEEEASLQPVLGGGHGVPKSNSSGRITKRARSRPKSLNNKNRKCSSPLVLQWLGENYETVPGSCLPRSVLYTHYQDFCKKNQMEPSSAASFGKIIRLKFPDLSTRRLGTRGQSKYHYYGLAIKETSIYYRSVYSKKGLTRFSGVANKRENGQTYNPSSKTGILLPNFPKISELNFSSPFPIDKVETFLIMYKAHCQRILDSVVRANFQEVQDFLIHFWQGMPTHMLPILGCQATIDLVVICDFILYRTLCEVLIPANLQSLPENLIDEIIVFSHNIVEWVFNALQDLPAALGIRKVQTCEMFGKSLRRQTALVQLAKGVRAVLRNSDDITELLQDWRTVDVEAMIVQPEACNMNHDLFRELAHELEQLFIKQSSLEVYFEWLDSIIEKQVSEPGEQGMSLVQLSHDFMASWTTFYTLLERQLSVCTSKSLEHYNSLHKLMDEYVHYVIELLQAQVIETQYNDVLRVSNSSTQLSTAVHGTGSLPPPPPLLPYHHHHHDIYGNATDEDPHLVLPPTPDNTPLSAITDRSDLFTSLGHHPHSRGAPPHTLPSSHHHHQQNNNVDYFPGDLNSPFVPGVPDGLCDGLIKLEFPYKCGMSMSSLTHDSSLPPFQLDTTTPLTPQSSHYAGSSPLSHVSMSASPEPPIFDPLPPHSSMHPCTAVSTSGAGSPALTTTPSSTCSPAPDMSPAYQHHQMGNAVVLAQGHAGAVGNDIDIVRSLDLIAGAPPVMTESFYAHPSLSPPIPSHTSSSSSASSCSTSPVRVPSFDQYEFELLQLMSNPDDLLADPKILQVSPAPTPIH